MQTAHLQSVRSEEESSKKPRIHQDQRMNCTGNKPDQRKRTKSGQFELGSTTSPTWKCPNRDDEWANRKKKPSDWWRWKSCPRQTTTAHWTTRPKTTCQSRLSWASPEADRSKPRRYLQCPASWKIKTATYESSVSLTSLYIVAADYPLDFTKKNNFKPGKHIKCNIIHT